MSWERGRREIEELLRHEQLQRVPSSLDMAERLLRDADAHLRLATLGIDDDPAGALQLGYDAARKACAALLVAQGLRATTQGGHVAVLRATRAQFGGADGIEVFDRVDRLRRRRHDTEYPSVTTPVVTPDDARQAVSIATAVVAAARSTLSTARVVPFR